MENKYVVTLVVNGSSQGEGFATVDEAVKWSAATVRDILENATHPSEISLEFYREGEDENEDVPALEGNDSAELSREAGNPYGKSYFD